eukprot:1964099-Prymnesium_polylepis.1
MPCDPLPLLGPRAQLESSASVCAIYCHLPKLSSLERVCGGTGRLKALATEGEVPRAPLRALPCAHPPPARATPRTSDRQLARTRQRAPSRTRPPLAGGDRKAD